jgi:hypothetical protein
MRCARLPRDRREMQECVGRPADGGMHDDGVLERVAGQNAPRREILVNHRDELFARRAGIAQQLGQRYRDERGPGQGEPERLGQHLPGAGAAHELACPTRRAGAALRALEVLPGTLASFDGGAHGPHLVRGDVVGRVQLRTSGQVDGREVAACDREQVGGHRLVVAGDQDHAVVGMPQGVDLDHRRHDVAGDERVAHAVGGLDDAVADVADGEDARFPAGLVDAVADFLDQLPEVERARVAHAVGAVHQDLRLAEIFLGPVHPEAERVSLMVHHAQSLAAELRSSLSHRSFPPEGPAEQVC